MTSSTKVSAPNLVGALVTSTKVSAEDYMYKNKNLFQASVNTLILDPAVWDDLSVPELNAEVISTNCLQPVTVGVGLSTELNFSGYTKIDFENSVIEMQDL